jgi:Glycosyl hydrolase family 63 C-terminal domain
MQGEKQSTQEPSLRAEYDRLDARSDDVPWGKWGPYLSERQWGTVREDYSQNGDAWDYFSHDQARSRTYRWGEDGIAGISDDKQLLCFCLALWNGADPILKERLFGLTNSEGNHGEDVKEYYFYLDSTPTHSYMKMLYKYPQKAYPYDDLVKTNKKRSRSESEYELLDTGVFDQNRYFDVFVEYAKADTEDVLISITAHNRGDQGASLHLLPTLWFRNTWWAGETTAERPMLSAIKDGSGIHADHPELGTYDLKYEGSPVVLFTNNETKEERMGGKSLSLYTKDAFHRYLLQKEAGAINSARTGTKAAVHYELKVPAGKSQTIRMRLTRSGTTNAASFDDFSSIMQLRLKEADDFYRLILPQHVSDDEKLVMRQAFAGMLWSKQYYYYDLERWLEQHDVPADQMDNVRNSGWFHMLTEDVISMPDKWEYPWFAAWDLAFHSAPLAMVDLAFAKNQLKLMLNSLYLHPNGQLPAYEWNFSDVNPPVHAWAVLALYRAERAQCGHADYAFLEQCFQKLLLNFTWWLNRKDATGKNVFQGGFLGLDNIGVFDRSSPLPTGGHLEQADGTAWMCLFSQNMLQIAIELSSINPLYSEMALKFTEHFLWIASAMDSVGDNDDEMWDEEDGFFYDILRHPNGQATRLKLRSMVGLLPLCATTVVEGQFVNHFPETAKRVGEFMMRHPELCENITSLRTEGVNGRRILALLNERKLRRVLHRMLDPNEFLSEYGIRSVSKCYDGKPFVFEYPGGKSSVEYLPAESNTGMFGGNSNWRGPIWIPVNALILRALYQFYQFYGDDFKIECPTGSGKMMTLYEVAMEINSRLSKIFLRDEKGRRAVYGGTEKFQNDPYWKDLILFHEYFHGENGAGLGASHQTGWTGVVAYLMRISALLNPEAVLKTESAYAAIQVEPHKPTST